MCPTFPAFKEAAMFAILSYPAQRAVMTNDSIERLFPNLEVVSPSCASAHIPLCSHAPRGHLREAADVKRSSERFCAEISEIGVDMNTSIYLLFINCLEPFIYCLLFI